MGILNTLKRVRKREKTPRVSQSKEKHRKIVDNFDIKETGQTEPDRYAIESGRYASIEEKNNLLELKETDETQSEKENDKKKRCFTYVRT